MDTVYVPSIVSVTETEDASTEHAQLKIYKKISILLKKKKKIFFKELLAPESSLIAMLQPLLSMSSPTVVALDSAPTTATATDIVDARNQAARVLIIF